jgi:hypothetical protein
MTEQEIRQVIIDNPTLPIYCMVGFQVYEQGDGDNIVAGVITRAKVDKIISSEVGGVRGYSDRVWLYSDIDELADELYDRWANAQGESFIVYDENGNEDPLAGVQAALEYAKSFAWQDCIVLDTDEAILPGTEDMIEEGAE